MAETLSFDKSVQHLLTHILAESQLISVETTDEVSVVETLISKIINDSDLVDKIPEIYLFHPNIAFDQQDQQNLFNMNLKTVKNTKLAVAGSVSYLPDVINAFTDVESTIGEKRNCLLFVYDYYTYSNDNTVQRALKHFSHKYRQRLKNSNNKSKDVHSGTNKNIVLFSPVHTIPTVLSDSVLKVDVGYPDINEIKDILRERIVANFAPVYPDISNETVLDKKWKLVTSREMKIDLKKKVASSSGKEEILTVPFFDFTSFKDDNYLSKFAKEMSGLSRKQIERIFLLSVKNYQVENPGKYCIADLKFISHEKIVINKFLIDELTPDINLNDVGGLGNVKREIQLVKVRLDQQARNYGVDNCKGFLMVGVPGTGKTTIAKAIGSDLELPVLRLDVGRVMGGVVGESERNLRMIIKKIDTMAPCVLLIDEIEKAFSGTGSSNKSDGGTMNRVFGEFLFWLQERKSDVFPIATANNVNDLPPELLRAGRFDTIFFVDLPEQKEREELLTIFTRQKPKPHWKFDIPSLAKKLAGFTGAEIYKIIERCVVRSYVGLKNETDSRGVITEEDVMKETVFVTKVADIKKEEIKKLREWAENAGAIPASNENLNIKFNIGMN